MFGSSIFGFAIAQIDSIIVARLLGASAVGSYQLAQKVSNVPATEVTHILNQLTLPAYSRMQDNIARLRTAYLKVLELSSFVIFFIAATIMVLGSDFVDVFLGKKWAGLAPILVIMAIAGTFRAIAATTGPVFYAIGKPKIDTFWQSIRLITISSLIYPLAVNYGTIGAALALLASTLVTSLGLCISTTHVLHCRQEIFIKAIFAGFLSALAAAAVVYPIKNNFTHINVEIFFCLLITFFAVYTLCALLVNKWLNYNLLKIIKEISSQFTTK
jgi:lipopolysaccharide exporter